MPGAMLGERCRKNALETRVTRTGREIKVMPPEKQLDVQEMLNLENTKDATISKYIRGCHKE